MSRLDDFHRLRSIITDECVIWPHALNPRGYGQFHYRGRLRNTHRLALILATGIDDPKLHAAHGPCHSPACMNVAHLRWATAAENLADRDRDGTHQRGERGPNARLTEVDVREILTSTENRVALAQRYGVTKRQIYGIKSGRAWRHIWEEVRETQRQETDECHNNS